MLSIVVIDILLTMVYICCGVYGYYQLPETAYKVLVYNMDIKKVLYIIGILILFVGVDLLKKVIDRFKGGK